MKRFLALILSVIIVFSLTACPSDTDDEQEPTSFIISNSMLEKYFGSNVSIGEWVQLKSFYANASEEEKLPMDLYEEFRFSLLHKISEIKILSISFVVESEEDCIVALKMKTYKTFGTNEIVSYRVAYLMDGKREETITYDFITPYFITGDEIRYGVTFAFERDNQNLAAIAFRISSLKIKAIEA